MYPDKHRQTRCNNHTGQRWYGVLLGALLGVGCAELPDTGSEQAAAAPSLCTPAWYRAIERQLGTGDGAGHGPDPGSEEWRSTVEFRLGVRGEPEVPARSSDAWCVYIDQKVQAGPESTEGPSYPCDRAVREGSTEAIICADEVLSALDRKLASVYRQALQRAVNEQPPILRAEQRGWIKGRDQCLQSDQPDLCIGSEYERRIAALQARYRLVSSSSPIYFSCDGNPAKEVVVTFFHTDPATLIAEYGDSVSLMYVDTRGVGIHYRGRNESFSRDQQGTRITWGYGAAAMQCQRLP